MYIHFLYSNITISSTGSLPQHYRNHHWRRSGEEFPQRQSARPGTTVEAFNMRQCFITVPTKSSVLALHRSLRRQARLLPHEYLRYRPLLCTHFSNSEPVAYYRQFFYLRLSTSIRSALDEGRKDKQRLGTVKRLRKVMLVIFAIAFTDPRPLGRVRVGAVNTNTCE